MALHMIKLAVGADSAEDLERWVARRSAENLAAGLGGLVHHDTRMAPKRAEELLDGGSLYWVIRGAIQIRQPLAGFTTVSDADGRDLCRILLEPKPIRTEFTPKRPFQGWRYLSAKDAPSDQRTGSGAVSPELAAALKDALAW